MFSRQIHRRPDVYEITVPFANISTSATNCYVIKDKGEVLVVDTGAPFEAARSHLLEGFKELGVDPAKASFFLTHLHLDHGGLVDDVIPLEGTIYVSEEEYRQTRPEAAEKRMSDMVEKLKNMGVDDEELESWRMIQKGVGHFLKTKHSFHFVKEGDSITVGDYELEVVDTSGHTSGHLSLFEPQKGLFFGGDHMLFVVSPSIDYFSSGQDSFEIYVNNLEKLKSLPIKVFFHSHGDIRDDFYSRIDWLIAHHKERAEETLQMIKQQQGIKGIDLVKNLHWNVPVDSWEEISIVQRFIIIVQGLVLLNHLEATRQIEKYDGNNGITRYRAL